MGNKSSRITLFHSWLAEEIINLVNDIAPLWCQFSQGNKNTATFFGRFAPTSGLGVGAERGTLPASPLRRHGLLDLHDVGVSIRLTVQTF